MSITSLTQVTNLVNDRIANTEAAVKKLIAQKVCYVRNKAIAPLIWAEEQAKEVYEAKIAKALADKAKIALDFAENALRAVNKNLAVIQTEINEMEAIQNRVLALIEGDASYNTTLFIDCSIVDGDSDLDALIAQAIAGISVDVTSEGVSVDVDVGIDLPDVGTGIIGDAAETAENAAKVTGSVVGTIERVQE